MSIVLEICLITILAINGDRGTTTEPRTMIVPCGTLKLHALLWCPSGAGPFPPSYSVTAVGTQPGLTLRVDLISDIPNCLHQYLYCTDMPSCICSDVAMDYHADRAHLPET